MLRLDPHIERPDDFYEALIEAHRGLSDGQSALFNAKLVLILANQVGDHATLLAALAKARDGFTPEGGDATIAATA